MKSPIENVTPAKLRDGFRQKPKAIRPTFRRGTKQVPFRSASRSVTANTFEARYPNYVCAVRPCVTEDSNGKIRVSLKPWGRGMIRRSQAKRRLLARRSGCAS